MKENTLLSIYGARVSKDGKRINLTLCEGKDDKRIFYCASVKLDNSGKVKVKLSDDKASAIFKVAMLSNKPIEKTDTELF